MSLSEEFCVYWPPDTEIEVAVSGKCILMVKFVDVILCDYLTYRYTIDFV
jgi:hypothetical protein